MVMSCMHTILCSQYFISALAIVNALPVLSKSLCSLRQISCTSSCAGMSSAQHPARPCRVCVCTADIQGQAGVAGYLHRQAHTFWQVQADYWSFGLTESVCKTQGALNAVLRHASKQLEARSCRHDCVHFSLVDICTTGYFSILVPNFCQQMGQLKV